MYVLKPLLSVRHFSLICRTSLNNKVSHCLALSMIQVFHLTIFTPKHSCQIFHALHSCYWCWIGPLNNSHFAIRKVVVNHTTLVTLVMFINAFPMCSLSFSNVIVVISWASKMIYNKRRCFIYNGVFRFCIKA